MSWMTAEINLFSPKIDFLMKILFAVLVVESILDATSTYYSVCMAGEAYEGNGFIVMASYVLGFPFIAMIVKGTIIVGTFIVGFKMKNDTGRFVILAVLISSAVLGLLVVWNNLQYIFVPQHLQIQQVSQAAGSMLALRTDPNSFNQELFCGGRIFG